MNTVVVGRIVALLFVGLSVSIMEATHWPDFSCLPHKEIKSRQNSINHHKMGWESCKESHQKYKQECDKMCVLRSRKVIRKLKREEPFKFYIEGFITLMLEELGFENEHRKEAPEELVNKVRAELEICKTNHNEYETMTNVRYLPCEPYIGLFSCIHNITGCSGDYYSE